MNAILVCTAMLLSGIDASWRLLPGGGVDYTIRVERETLDLLRSGEQMIESEVPAEVRDVRMIHVLVVDPKPVRESPAAAAEKPAAEKPAPAVPEKTGEQAGPRYSNGPRFAQGTWGTLAPLRPAAPSKTAAQPAPPATLHADPASKPISFVEPAVADAGKTKQPAAADPPKPAEPAKPWLPMSLACVALFASLGGNFYLGWLFWDARGRYRALLQGSALPSMSDK